MDHRQDTHTQRSGPSAVGFHSWKNCRLQVQGYEVEKGREGNAFERDKRAISEQQKLSSKKSAMASPIGTCCERQVTGALGFDWVPSPAAISLHQNTSQVLGGSKSGPGRLKRVAGFSEVWGMKSELRSRSDPGWAFRGWKSDRVHLEPNANIDD